jgi:heat shock protein HtpX
MNALKTGLLLLVLTVGLMAIGQVVGGPRGATLALGFALLMNVGAYWFSDRLVLALYRARPLSEAEAPGVFRIVRDLARQAGMPMPRLYGIDNPTPNAFATGRSPQHASVAVTSGLLRLMEEDELRGVLAHELSHVKHRDTLIMTVAATLAGAIMWLADMARWGLWFGGGRDNHERASSANALRLVALLAVIILAPIAATLIQLAISRTREYAADEKAAHTTGDPYGLAAALAKLQQANEARPLVEANAATAHLFIVNPLHGVPWAALFSTHPPIADRIQRLHALAQRLGH